MKTFKHLKPFLTIILFVLFTCYPLSGQTKISISGSVYDKNTGEALIGATVFETKTKTGTVCNEFGFYSISLQTTDSIVLIVTFIGYKPELVKIAVQNQISKNFFLTKGLEIGEVNVTAEKYANVVQCNETGVLKINMKQVKELPNLFGEADIIKSLQLMPGVQSGGEGSNSLYVRGGSPDQNLILLDDVPLYYVSHFGGFYSIFNPDAINDVKLIKGGFPARYGSRLSSVLDIRMKDGNNQKLGGNVTLGLLSSKFTLEGPIVKDKSSYLIAFRKNILPVFKLLGEGIAYNFYDLNAKINHKLSKKDKLFFSFYMGDDVIRVKNKIDENGLQQKDKKTVKWGNILGAFRWNHIYSNKLFSNITLYNTYYSYHNNFEYSYEKEEENLYVNDKMASGINDFSIKADYSWFPLQKLSFRFGGQSIYHTFIPNDKKIEKAENGQADIDSSYSSRLKSIENAIYFEGETKWKHFNANAGLRLSSYHLKNKSYYAIEPRLLLNFILNKNFSVKYSYSSMNQYVHLLTYSGTGMPSDFWMPTTENVPPELSEQHTASFVTSFFDNRLEISVESYYKTLAHLITFIPGKSFNGYLDNWEDIVEKKGKGKSYGLELLINKPIGRLTGWVGVTLSKAERQFLEINEGLPYPFKYDRLFDIGTAINYKITDKIALSTTWTYGAGYPVTLATEKYYAEGKEVYVYHGKNSFRMNDYHRLDIAINFYKELKKGERTWNISIFNVYNRKNPYYYYYDREYETYVRHVGKGYETGSVPGPLKLYQKSLFSFFPSFSYSYNF